MTKLLITIFVLLYSTGLMAATAFVQSATGSVQATIGANAPIIVTKDSPLENGATITTGDNSQVVIKFEDGQEVALNANTSFKINNYHFEQAKPENNSALFSLFKGAMRSVTGLIGKTNPEAFKLNTPVATIGIRGTDFMAATGSLYLQVLNGTITASTSAGTTAFAAGQIGFISTLSTLPAVISAAQLPTAVASSFSQLGSLTLEGASAATGSTSASSGSATGTTGAAGATSGAAATGAAVGGVAASTVAVGAVAVAGVAAITSNNSSSPNISTSTTTSTK